jgi:hypothetical protein
MKTNIAILAAVTMIASAWTAGASLSFTSGYDTGASNEGGVRYRNFQPYNGGGTTYEGTHLGSGSGYVQQTAGSYSNPNWLASQTFTFAYDATAGTLSSTVGSNPTLTYTYATAPSDINYLQLLITPDNNAVVTLTGLQLNGVDLSGANGNDYGKTTLNGTGNWYLADNSLMSGFTLTGSINWNQVSSGSQESAKIEFDLGNSALAPVPEPTTMLAGALLLLPFGASTLRMLRKARAA